MVFSVRSLKKLLINTISDVIMKNEGKRFEEDIKKSVPDYALLHRLPDPPQSFGGSNNLRFSKKNPFDFILWDSKRCILYALEAKTVKGKSISFERTKDEHGEIHYHQIKGLLEWDNYNGTVCGFIIEFREIETTVFISIADFINLMNATDKKSFNFNDLQELNIPFISVPQNKKRTHYLYDIEHLLDNVLSD